MLCLLLLSEEFFDLCDVEYCLVAMHRVLGSDSSQRVVGSQRNGVMVMLKRQGKSQPGTLLEGAVKISLPVSLRHQAVIPSDLHQRLSVCGSYR